MIKERLKSFFNSIDQKIRGVLDKYDEVMREGGYHSEPQSFISFLFNKREKSAIETPTAAVGQLGVGASKTLLQKIAIGAGIALLSTQMALGLGIGLAVFGVTFKVVEYMRAKKARLEIIEERNFAEQLVRGSRRDLCRLHIAQKQILNLKESFQQASKLTTADTIDNIIKSVDNERSRVRVLDPGRYGMDIEMYDFTEPAMKPVNYRPHMRQRKMANNATLASSGELQSAWDNKRTGMSEEEIVNTLVKLQQAIPGHMKEAVIRKLEKEKTDVMPGKAA